MNRERKQAFLDEMGLTPLWSLRHVSVMGEVTHEPQSDAVTGDATSAKADSHSLSATTTLRSVSTRSAPQLDDEEAKNAIPANTPVARPVVPPAHVKQYDEDDILAPAVKSRVTDSRPISLVKTSADAADIERFKRIAQMGWTELSDAVSGCTACALCEGRNKTVFGVGDRKAKWMFIGEGPGRSEDQQGEPFVGKAGQLLDSMLRALDMDRGHQCYIANIVKCRPTNDEGKDRPPSANEAGQCLPYLQRQIALIQPTVLIALGKTAALGLLGGDPDTSVSSLRGKRHTYQGVPLIVTYHPAYLLRSPADKGKVWEDLCFARSIYAERKP